MHLLYGPASTYTIATGGRTDSEILDLLSEAGEALSFDTIKFCLRISKDTTYNRLQSLSRYGLVRLVTKKKTSYWKIVEGGE